MSMRVERFFGTTTAAAMKRVRASLGEDAMVLANRATDNGVEILVLPAEDAERLAAAPSIRGGGSARHEAPAPRLRMQGSDPAIDLLWQRMRGAGFSRDLGESLLSVLPGQLPQDWLAGELAARLRMAVAGSLINARVVVLVGPTGVGKTTMAARLAAAHAEQHRAEEVALVSADIDRPAARHQLRWHASRLGVDFYSMEQALDLGEFIQGLEHKRLILIDAPGFSQRDERLAAQIRWLCGSGDVTPVLVLNAAHHPDALIDTVTRYRQATRAAGASLDDVIVTKADEAPRLGPVLDVLIREQLCLHFLCADARISDGVRTPMATMLIAEALADDCVRGSGGTAPQIHRLVQQSCALGQALALLRQHVARFDALEQAWHAHATGTPSSSLAPSNAAAGVDNAAGTSSSSLARSNAAADVANAHGTPSSSLACSDAIPPAPGTHDNETERSPTADPGRVHALWWTHKPAPAAFGLDTAGLPVLGAFHHSTRADEIDALAEDTARFTAAAHLLPHLPYARIWHWLSAQNLSWASRARANQRIWYAGQPHLLSQCHAIAEDAGSVSVHWRRRIVQAILRHLRVAVPIPGGRVCGLLDAWFADLRDARTGASVAVRYFLLPAGLDHERSQALIAGHLRAHALAELAGRAATRLARPSTLAANAVDAGLAATLAALACRVDAEDSPWAMELRATLRNLVDRRRRQGAVVMLDALLRVLATRDALRELGVPECARRASYDDVPGMGGGKD